MITGNDDDEQLIVCQRSFGKRRRKSKPFGSDEYDVNKPDRKCMDNEMMDKSTTPRSWIDNSFGLKVPNMGLTAENGKDEYDVLNNSDFLLAQLDVEELSKAQEDASTSTCKQLQKNLTEEFSCETVRQAHNQNVSTSNASDESDLFDDHDFDAIIAPQIRVSPQNSSKIEVSHKSEFIGAGEEESEKCRSKKETDVVDQYANENFCSRKSDEKYSSITDKESSTSRYDSVKDHCGISIDESSVKRKSISLKEKMKERLLMNGSISTTNAPDENKLREAVLAHARMEASQIRKEGTNVDIGPFYGLPSKVGELFKSLRGIDKLYDWQNECLSLPAVKEHKNLIYTLPTSGGKTLVAEILILRELLCHQKDTLLVLPFVSIVQEKVRTISEFASELEFIVEEYAGSKGRFPPIKRRKKHSLYIATIEKGHSLVNSLIEDGRLDTLGLVVVDELHMLGEGGSRGANLESMLLKLLHSEAKSQIIGMSATLNNLKDLKNFLHAEVYSSDFRPVSLQEYVKVEDNIYHVNNATLDKENMLEHSRVALFPYTSECLNRDPDHLLGLITEVIPKNSCLVFCSTKKNCENVAQLLSELICKHHRHLSQVKKDERKMLLKELREDGNGKICPILKYTVHFGIAYHHSGLTMDERRLIEDAYLEGTLCILTCTSTLAAGVNLPARRVILRSPYVGMNFIKYSQYKQMTGRAGRAGIDSFGESILIAKRQDRMKVKDLLAGPKDYCYSSLIYDGGKGIQTLLLSSIGLKLIASTQSAFSFLEHSLLHTQAKELDVDIAALSKEAIQFLIDQKLIIQGTNKPDSDENFLSIQVTDLGRATFKGSVDHVYSCQLYKDLKTAEQSLVLSNHFHLLFLVTPYDTANSITPAWDVYYKQFCNLAEAEIHVAKLIGISESYLNRRAMGLSSRQKIDTMATNRFFLTLMLWRLWNRHSIWDVANQFSQPRGFVQNLLAQSASFASCIYHFCQELEEFWAFRDLLANFVKRLSYCVTVELVPLMEVSGVKLARAKQLYSAGLTSLASLAAAEANELVTKIELLSKRQAQQIISAAKNLLEEKTAALLEEVETLVSVPNTTS